jgi:hypothetical protein
MKQTLLAILLAAGLVTAAAAAPSVAGTWTLNVTGSPHGDVAMGLTLKQDGTKVTGVFNSPHGDMDVAGEFVNGELKIATTSGAEDEKILFNAKLKDDGTLAGYVSSQMGDMKWTAMRTDEKKK